MNYPMPEDIVMPGDEPDDDSALLMSAAHGNGITICGIAPSTALTTIDKFECFNCQKAEVVRKFSGSGWYEDSFICRACGEDNGTGYRPFAPAWRKKNIARAEEWATTAIPLEEYFAKTIALIHSEMGWDGEPKEDDA